MQYGFREGHAVTVLFQLHHMSRERFVFASVATPGCTAVLQPHHQQVLLKELCGQDPNVFFRAIVFHHGVAPALFYTMVLLYEP